jgi:hypothetical protein
MSLLFNRVTTNSRLPGKIYVVSAEWLGGNDRQRVTLENIYPDESSAVVKWQGLTAEAHNRSYNRPDDYDDGFVRHPIRVFSEEE